MTKGKPQGSCLLKLIYKGACCCGVDTDCCALEMKFLITGANGFVGRALCAELLRRGHAIRRTPIRFIIIAINGA